jgi:hypothetical protein
VNWSQRSMKPVLVAFHQAHRFHGVQHQDDLAVVLDIER